MVYTWYCNDCKERTEVERSMREIDVAPHDGCDRCGSSNLQRIIARPSRVKGFILEGNSGWHDTEYTRYRSIK